MSHIDVRATIMKVMPYKELLTSEQVQELVKDELWLTPEDKLKGLFGPKGEVSEELDRLRDEGILSAGMHPKTDKYCFYQKFKHVFN